MTTYQKRSRLQRAVSEERLAALIAQELRTLSPLTSGQLAARLLLDQSMVLRMLRSLPRFQILGKRGRDQWIFVGSEVTHDQ